MVDEKFVRFGSRKRKFCLLFWRYFGTLGKKRKAIERKLNEQREREDETRFVGDESSALIHVLLRVDTDR